jgi:hypothetical protein
MFAHELNHLRLVSLMNMNSTWMQARALPESLLEWRAAVQQSRLVMERDPSWRLVAVDLRCQHVHVNTVTRERACAGHHMRGHPPGTSPHGRHQQH